MSIDKSLFEIIRKIPNIKHDSTNPHFKNKYASLEGILDVVKPICFEAGVYFRWTMDATDVLTLSFVHAATGEKLSGGTYKIDCAQAPTPQAKGSAINYAKRYMLCAALCIATTDDDGEEASRAPTEVRRASVPASRPAPKVVDEVYNGSPEQKPTLLKMMQDHNVPTARMATVATECAGLKYSEIVKKLEGFK